jgi:hypothetical protein
MVVVMIMGVSARRTGGFFNLSATRFTVMSAAVLA